ncbi:MAG: sugar ABC transporter substrate-binding protein [Firmicutes bacterium]|nr:sugar ABC transporter substrate-binding protein [Bacillota bacterium]
MKKSKLFSLITLVLAMLMVFVACAPAANNEADPTEGKSDAQVQTPADKEDEPAAEPVTITYCNFNSSGGNEETLAKMVAAFEAAHPNIKVEVETIGYDDYFTQMQTRVAGGTAPDCYELNIENFAAYANKGLLAEISGVDVSALNETALNAFNVGGKQYGLPESFSNVILIYNKDLFDQAGVAYPTDDWTQADLQVAAEKIRALGDDIFGIWQPITYNEFFKVVAQYGGALLNEDKTQFTINSPENLAAAQALVDRVLVSNVQPNAVQQGGMGDWDMFMSGRLGMIPTGIWAFQTFTDNCDFEWDIVVEPGSTQKATHFFSNCVVMNPETKHPEEVATWLAWLASSTDSADIRLAAGWDLPALKDLNALSAYLDITPPANREAVFKSLDYLVMPPVIEDYALMSDIIGQKLAAAAEGTITVQEALDQAQAECEAQIKLG